MIKNDVMRGIANTLNITGALLIGGIGVIGMTDGEMFWLGFAFITIAIALGLGLHSLINLTHEQRDEIRGKPEPAGVHWFWWVFWLIVFLPALIIVAIIHTGRKTRAEIRNSKQEA